MKLREENIIVCDCGAELNPEIITETDFIKYVDGVATCSSCGASGVIEFPKPPVEVVAVNLITEALATIAKKPTTVAECASQIEVIKDLLG